MFFPQTPYLKTRGQIRSLNIKLQGTVTAHWRHRYHRTKVLAPIFLPDHSRLNAASTDTRLDANSEPKWARNVQYRQQRHRLSWDLARTESGTLRNKNREINKFRFGQIYMQSLQYFSTKTILFEILTYLSSYIYLKTKWHWHNENVCLYNKVKLQDSVFFLNVCL